MLVKIRCTFHWTNYYIISYINNKTASNSTEGVISINSEVIFNIIIRYI